jgi:protein tyrosine/serine phosphatase
MEKKKRLSAGLITILLIAAAVVLLVKHFHIKDFCVVKPGVLYTSGQPRGMDYPRLLYKYHIATIVNIRPASEHRDQNWHSEEISWTKSNGVNYIEMPIEKGRFLPDKQTQDQFLTIMADKNNLPVLLHGSSDDKRVAMLMAVWLQKNQGYTVEQTVRAVKAIIDGKELTEDEIKFIADLAPAPVFRQEDVVGP